MKRVEKWTVVGIGILATAIDAAGLPNTASTPYRTILSKNPFHLVPPRVPIVTPSPPRPPDEIFLTGIASVLQPATALLARRTAGSRETEYMALRAGESQDGIEVVSIVESAGLVTLKAGGIVRVISFRDDSLQAAARHPGPALPQ